MTSYDIRGAETDTTSIRERFGGIDTPAALSGMLAALGTIVFLGSLITAGAGSLDYQLNAIDIEGNMQEVAIGGAIASLLVVFVAFFIGGWAAGRIARFNGVMNGIGAALWMLLLIAVFAALGAFVGAEYNAFQQTGLPDWFSQFSSDEATTGAIVAGIILILAMFGGAAFGGSVGDSYNRRVDAALTDNSTRRRGDNGRGEPGDDGDRYEDDRDRYREGTETRKATDVRTTETETNEPGQSAETHPRDPKGP
ncbi:MAG: hypothetical protein GEU79_06115 [Acidimicrobiia bacterium]|nr:hypothetical protein [Acidimicrobiia bacterium]